MSNHHAMKEEQVKQQEKEESGLKTMTPGSEKKRQEQKPTGRDDKKQSTNVSDDAIDEQKIVEIIQELDDLRQVTLTANKCPNGSRMCAQAAEATIELLKCACSESLMIVHCALCFLAEILVQDKTSGKVAHALATNVRSVASLMRCYSDKNNIQMVGVSILIVVANAHEVLEPVAEQDGIPAVMCALETVTHPQDSQAMACSLFVQALKMTSCSNELKQQIQEDEALYE